MTNEAGASPTGAPRWGNAPWQISVEIPTTALPSRCQVAVIGAGFAGLSAAYHLARRGARVVVLEAESIGAGASGRTGGLALEGTAAGPREQVDHCLDALAALVAERTVACDLSLTGCWQVRHEPEAAGQRPGWRDGDQRIVVAGTEPGGTVDPGKLVTGLAEGAGAFGVEIHPHTPVRAIEARGPADYRVRCERGELVAEHVVVALNAYTVQLLALPVRLRSALTLALCTVPVDDATLDAIGLADRVPFYTVDFPYLWGRSAPDQRLVFGAGLIFPADGDVRHVMIDDRETGESMARLEARVHALHPAIGNLEVTHRWGGPIAFRHDGVPILSRLPGMEGVIAFAGCAGHGVALSVRVGQLIAAAIADGAALPAWGALR